MFVYIAGPYTSPDPAVNVRRAIDSAQSVMRMGHVPHIPHLSHFWHMIYPGEYEQWMSLDFAWLSKCDVLLRLPGASPGADREMLEAARLGLRVVMSVGDIGRGAARRAIEAGAER